MGKGLCRKEVLLPGDLLPEAYRAPGKHHVRAQPESEGGAQSESREPPPPLLMQGTACDRAGERAPAIPRSPCRPPTTPLTDRCLCRAGRGAAGQPARPCGRRLRHSSGADDRLSGAAVQVQVRQGGSAAAVGCCRRHCRHQCPNLRVACLLPPPPVCRKLKVELPADQVAPFVQASRGRQRRRAEASAAREEAELKQVGCGVGCGAGMNLLNAW